MELTTFNIIWKSLGYVKGYSKKEGYIEKEKDKPSWTHPDGFC